MKKRLKIFQRVAALLCCILLLPSLVAVPAFAASDDEVGFFNVLEFGTANGSGSQVVTGTLPFDVVYETTREPFFYVDMVVVSDYAIQITYAGVGLTRQLIDNQNGAYRYRFYGNLVGDPSGYLTFHIYYSSSVQATVIFEQLRVSSFKTNAVPSVGTVLASPYEWIPSEAMPDPDTPASITLKSADVSFPYDFFAKLSLTEWVKFDYIDVYFTCRVASISSISVQFDGQYLPYELSYLESSFFPDGSWGSDGASPPDNIFNCVMRIDLTGVNRSVNDVPVIYIDGLYEPYWPAQGITLNSVTGIVIGDVPSELGTFWQRLQGLLVALFGSDPAASDAKVQQDSFEKQSNEFILDAVNDWDHNIDYAETQFKNGFEYVTPSIMWISTLATKIFTSLGSFGSMYLIAGLMSVIMLLLSKSGVAAKLAGSVRRNSGGGNKNA